MRRQKLFRTSTLKFRQSFRELTQTFLILVTHMQTLPNGDEKAKDLAGRFIKNFAKYESNEAGKALVSAGPQL
mgnify:CR=1 FL=1